MSCPVHRPSAALVLLLALLYGALTAFATGCARAADVSAQAPHVALILPLGSPSYGRHADAVRLGFLAAAKVAGKEAPPIRIYAVNEDVLNVITIYEQAVEAGARLVVGPLTRNGATSLAASNMITVPTLTLNTIGPRMQQPPHMYLFGLNIEIEARQIAQLAINEGRRNAFVIGDDTPLGKRMRQTFVEEFARLGGSTVAELGFGADPASLSRLRDATGLGIADMAFLALDSARARVVRPYFANTLGIYATSQVNAGYTDALAARDLNLVRFVDMPWLLQADHPAVMVYPHPQFGDAIDDRLYALGIDAFRIGLDLLRRRRDPVLDGVTGRIRLIRNQQYVRELSVAQYVDGKTVILREPHP